MSCHDCTAPVARFLNSTGAEAGGVFARLPVHAHQRRRPEPRRLLVQPRPATTTSTATATGAPDQPDRRAICIAEKAGALALATSMSWLLSRRRR